MEEPSKPKPLAKANKRNTSGKKLPTQQYSSYKEPGTEDLMQLDDDANETASAWNRLSIKEKELALLDADVNPEVMNLTVAQKCEKIGIAARTYYKAISNPDFREVCDALMKDRDKYLISKGVRTIILNEVVEAQLAGRKLTDKKAELYLRYTGDLLADTNITFNTTIGTNLLKDAS